MLRRLEDSIELLKAHVCVEPMIVAVCNGAEEEIGEDRYVRSLLDENEGFANGFNAGIGAGLIAGATSGEFPDYWLILNNDLEFPHLGWLIHLFKARDPQLIVAPATDRTATPEAKMDGPTNRDPIPAHSVSAYCWLFPESMRKQFAERAGFPLFDPDFESYGEDDWTSLLMQHYFGPHPFRVVPRAWVKHLKAQTAAIVRPDRAASSKLLCDKIRAFLRANTGASKDVIQKAQWHLRMLKR